MWYCKYSQIHMAGAVTDSRKKRTSVSSLDQLNFLLYSKFVSLYSQINVPLIFETDEDCYEVVQMAKCRE